MTTMRENFDACEWGAQSTI